LFSKISDRRSWASEKPFIQILTLQADPIKKILNTLGYLLNYPKDRLTYTLTQNS